MMGNEQKILIVVARPDRDGIDGLVELASPVPGLTVVDAVPEPGDDLPKRAVLVDSGHAIRDPRAHPALRAWKRKPTRWSVIAGPASLPGAGAGPPYPFELSVREALCSLVHSEDARIGRYAADPACYAEDTGENRRDFRRRLSASRKRDDGESWEGLWETALKSLARPGRVRDLGDLTLAWIPAEVGVDLGLEAVRCIQRVRHDWCRRGTSLPTHPLLLLVHDGDEPPDFGAGDPRHAVSQVRLLAQDPDAPAGLPGWRTIAAPSHFNHGWDWQPGSMRDPGARARALDQDLSALLARQLDAERPLRHYGCTLFFPFDPGHRQDPGDTAPEPNPFDAALERRVKSQHTSAVRQRKYGTAAGPESLDSDQARIYFLPQLRELLFDTGRPAGGDDGPDPIREWELTDTGGWRLELKAGDEEDWSCASVAWARLYRYFNGIYLLALRLELPAPSGVLTPLDQDNVQWWHPLAFADPSEVRKRSLAAWLGFTRLARVTYPSFAEQWDEGKLAAEVRLKGVSVFPLAKWQPYVRTGEIRLLSSPGESLSDVLRYLLKRFFGDGPFASSADLTDFLSAYPHIDDDRLFVSVAYGLAGPPPETPQRASRLRRLFSLALFVDRPEEDTFADCGDHAYDRTWLEGALMRASLGLWDETGQYAGFTDMSNAYLGHGEFFNGIVAPRHVPHIYERMLIMALFYRASLRRYSRQVADATGLLIGGDTEVNAGRKDFRELRKRFIDFTNRYWFHELTGQLQGKQMFRQQQQALGLTGEYDFIKDEMERAHEFLEAQRENRMAELANRVGAIGLFVAIAALWIALLPLVPLDGGIGPLPESWAHFWTLAARAGGIGLIGFLPPVIAFLAFAVPYLVWRRRIRRNT
jgi:hypothetical protein